MTLKMSYLPTTKYQITKQTFLSCLKKKIRNLNNLMNKKKSQITFVTTLKSFRMDSSTQCLTSTTLNSQLYFHRAFYLENKNSILSLRKSEINSVDLFMSQALKGLVSQHFFRKCLVTSKIGNTF